MLQNRRKAAVIRIHDEVAVFVGKGNVTYPCIRHSLIMAREWPKYVGILQSLGVFPQFGVVGLINEIVQ